MRIEALIESNGLTITVLTRNLEFCEYLKSKGFKAGLQANANGYIDYKLVKVFDRYREFSKTIRKVRKHARRISEPKSGVQSGV